MFAGSEFADRLAATVAEPHKRSEWTVDKIGGIRNLGCYVAHDQAFPEQVRPCVQRVTVPHTRFALYECIKLSTHELVAGCSAGS